MNPEKRQLLNSLLDKDEASRRQAILTGGKQILRRRRWRRAAWRGFAGMAIVALSVLSIQKMTVPRPQALAAIALPREQTTGLTDADLLAMFTNTPVGLITLEGGKKRLIFPRSGDEERFMARY